MKKIVLLSAIFLILGNCGYAFPVSGSVSRDYDLGFEAVVKRKFGEILKFSKIFENNDDIFYNRRYKPLYMLSIRELYDSVVTVKSNIAKRKVPDTYNLSLSGRNEEAQNTVIISQNQVQKADNTNVENNNEFNKIKARYDKLLEQNPGRTEIMYEYAQFLYANNKNSEAIAVLNKIIAENNGFVLAYYTLGNIYFDMGEYKNAIKANLVVIERNPFCADAYFNIASALEKLQKFNLAIDYYQKCLSINANDTQAQDAIKRLEQITYAY